MLLLLAICACLRSCINYERDFFIVAKLIVHWWLFGRCVMILSCSLFTEWNYGYPYMSVMGTIVSAYFIIMVIITISLRD